MFLWACKEGLDDYVARTLRVEHGLFDDYGQGGELQLMPVQDEEDLRAGGGGGASEFGGLGFEAGFSMPVLSELEMNDEEEQEVEEKPEDKEEEKDSALVRKLKHKMHNKFVTALEPLGYLLHQGNYLLSESFQLQYRDRFNLAIQLA